MPNRFLKDSICTSDNIDRLTAFQETFFYRLIVNCDDFGRMDARPKVLAAKLYPLKSLREEQVTDALRALTSAELVTLYEVGGKPFVQMNTWGRHQQKRANKSKYPGPDDGREYHLITNDINGKQPISGDNNCALYSNTNTNTNSNNEDEKSACARETHPSLIEDEDALRIQQDHSEVFDCLKENGFDLNQRMMKAAVELYAEHGKEKLLEAINCCFGASGNKWNYLKGVLEHWDEKKPEDEEDEEEEFNFW